MGVRSCREVRVEERRSQGSVERRLRGDRGGRGALESNKNGTRVVAARVNLRRNPRRLIAHSALGTRVSFFRSERIRVLAPPLTEILATPFALAMSSQHHARAHVRPSRGPDRAEQNVRLESDRRDEASVEEERDGQRRRVGAVRQEVKRANLGLVATTVQRKNFTSNLGFSIFFFFYSHARTIRYAAQALYGRRFWIVQSPPRRERGWRFGLRNRRRGSHRRACHHFSYSNHSHLMPCASALACTFSRTVA